ncbi:hypothetical protein C8F04DRAFT_1349591, partial [Mycena alexandri]
WLFPGPSSIPHRPHWRSRRGIVPRPAFAPLQCAWWGCGRRICAGMSCSAQRGPPVLPSRKSSVPVNGVRKPHTHPPPPLFVPRSLPLFPRFFPSPFPSPFPLRTQSATPRVPPGLCGRACDVPRALDAVCPVRAEELQRSLGIHFALCLKSVLRCRYRPRISL